MKKTKITPKILLISLLLGVLCQAPCSAQSDSLIGLVGHNLIKIDRNTGGYTLFKKLTNVPSGAVLLRMAYSINDRCYYTLDRSSAVTKLGRIDGQGNYTTIGEFKIDVGTFYFADAIAYDNIHEKLYVSASLNGPNPPDAVSETILEVNPLTAECVRVRNVGYSNTDLDADAMTYNCQGDLFLADGAVNSPGGARLIFYKMSLENTNEPVTLHQIGHEPIRGFCISNNFGYYTVGRNLYRYDYTNQSISLVKSVYSSTEFGGEELRGLTYYQESVSMEDTAFCQGDSILLRPRTKGDLTSWMGTDPIDSAYVSSAGKYWFEVRIKSCVSRDSFHVFQAQSPLPPLPDTAFCESEEFRIDLTNFPIAGFLWSDGQEGGSRSFIQPGIYSYLAYFMGCPFTDTFLVQHSSGPEFDIQDTSLCGKPSLSIEAPIDGANYMWSDGSSSRSNSIGEVGIYWLEISNDTCGFRDTFEVREATWELSTHLPDQTICIGDSILYNVDQYLEHSFLWSTGDTSAHLHFSQEGQYWVQITRDSCPIVDTFSIYSENCEGCSEFWVPNAFTPNQDVFNPEFSPSINCQITHYELYIFNRWGEKLYESFSYDKGWNGTFKSVECEEEVYLYLIRFRVNNAQRETYTLKGTFHLIR